MKSIKLFFISGLFALSIGIPVQGASSSSKVRRAKSVSMPSSSSSSSSDSYTCSHGVKKTLVTEDILVKDKESIARDELTLHDFDFSGKSWLEKQYLLFIFLRNAIVRFEKDINNRDTTLTLTCFNTAYVEHIFHLFVTNIPVEQLSDRKRVFLVSNVGKWCFIERVLGTYVSKNPKDPLGQSERETWQRIERRYISDFKDHTHLNLGNAAMFQSLARDYPAFCCAIARTRKNEAEFIADMQAFYKCFILDLLDPAIVTVLMERKKFIGDASPYNEMGQEYLRAVAMMQAEEKKTGAKSSSSSSTSSSSSSSCSHEQAVDIVFYDAETEARLKAEKHVLDFTHKSWLEQQCLLYFLIRGCDRRCSKALSIKEGFAALDADYVDKMFLQFIAATPEDKLSGKAYSLLTSPWGKWSFIQRIYGVLTGRKEKDALSESEVEIRRLIGKINREYKPLETLSREKVVELSALINDYPAFCCAVARLKKDDAEFVRDMDQIYKYFVLDLLDGSVVQVLMERDGCIKDSNPYSDKAKSYSHTLDMAANKEKEEEKARERKKEALDLEKKLQERKAQADKEAAKKEEERLRLVRQEQERLEKERKKEEQKRLQEELLQEKERKKKEREEQERKKKEEKEARKRAQQQERLNKEAERLEQQREQEREDARRKEQRDRDRALNRRKKEELEAQKRLEEQEKAEKARIAREQRELDRLTQQVVKQTLYRAQQELKEEAEREQKHLLEQELLKAEQQKKAEQERLEQLRREQEAQRDQELLERIQKAKARRAEQREQAEKERIAFELQQERQKKEQQNYLKQQQERAEAEQQKSESAAAMQTNSIQPASKSAFDLLREQCTTFEQDLDFCWKYEGNTRFTELKENYGKSWLVGQIAKKWILRAVNEGDVTALQYICGQCIQRRAKIDLDFVDENGQTPLSIAVKAKIIDLIAELFKHGGRELMNVMNDPNLSDGKTPLQIAYELVDSRVINQLSV